MKPNRKIYWDTTCWLAWLNDERHVWPTSVMQGLEDVVYEVESGSAVLFTSAVTRGEIFFGRLDLDKKNKFAKLMRRSNVREINADPRVMDRVSSIREYHSARGQRIETADAAHLATAILYRADEFHTMDGLQKDGGKHRKLLKLNGDVGGYNLKVVHPYPRNTPPAEMVTVRGPLFPVGAPGAVSNEPTTNSQEDHKLEADPAHPPTVQGGDEGRAEGEAAGERKKAFPR
jgi:predicted nucleic acid-binding protein